MKGWVWSCLAIALALSTTLPSKAQSTRELNREKIADVPPVLEAAALGEVLPSSTSSAPVTTDGTLRTDNDNSSLAARPLLDEAQPELGLISEEEQSRPSQVGSAIRLRSNPWFVGFGLAQGHLLPNTSVLSHRNADGGVPRWAPQLTFEIGRRTDGSREWHDTYRLPSYGFGFSSERYGDGGNARPLSAYTFFSWPFARLSDRAGVTTDFGFGLSWNWNGFESRSDEYGTVTGSNIKYHIDWGFYLRYLTTPRTSLSAGLDFTHWSNGGMRQPNQGMTVIGPKVGLRYNLGVQTPPRDAVPSPFHPEWELVVGGAGGFKNVIEQAQGDVALTERLHNFGAFNATTALQRHFYRFGKVAFGSDLTYDGSLGANIDTVDRVRVEERADTIDRFAVGLYTGYEQIIARFSAVVQAGYTIARGFDDPNMSRFYQRYGWRYRFSDRLWGTFGIRAISVNRANFLEFGIGYRWRWECFRNPCRSSFTRK